METIVERIEKHIDRLSFVINKDAKIKGVKIYDKKKNEYTNEEKKMIKVFESMPL